jgi:hypothetical protein
MTGGVAVLQFRKAALYAGVDGGTGPTVRPFRNVHNEGADIMHGYPEGSFLKRRALGWSRAAQRRRPIPEE